ncbi:nucleotidyltransferase [Clostridium botulinum]|nr:nucleotidyltransferase [Clostridium botulinum]NFI18708.1 nucleotidyltransferase [Clostridium botulinum]NFL93170.1 nucleotidyltransferase [Clostridium botulinum]NFN53143.1 nucleotidyltransferase [Clostridium botulinum]NFO25686.1 nucleotidyltransferase [Clostridium botulinum]
MYDLSLEFKKFYYNKVVLSKKETTNLREKKNLNITRLKDGLDEYNEEKKTNYKVAETLEQGSVAMATVTQNENNDYDIDVAIIFDKTNLGELGPLAVKNVVVEALKKKCTNFKTEPEALTNCVRIVYSDNYHIDFAIYRRIKNNDSSYKYEHAGSEWRERDPRAINKWFKDEIKTHGEKLRQAVRLSKMFCKSRESWQMPGGLIQSVLCNEKIQDYERMDEMFYYTMKEVQSRLEENKEVKNPTSDQSLLLKEKDKDKLNNLCNRLKDKLSKLDILDECSKKEAIKAWYEFFKHDYWTYNEDEENRSFAAASEAVMAKSINNKLVEYDDTEEYIDNIMPVAHKYNVSVQLNCWVFRNGKAYSKLRNMLLRGEKVKKGDNLYFYIDTEKSNLYGSYNVYLKVKNVGEIAENINSIRGEIFNVVDYEMIDNKYHYEEASFEGQHFVECYIEQNGVCVAQDFLNVPIG